MPAVVSGTTGVRAIAAGGSHTLARLADGTVRAWGANGTGQVGDGTTVTRLLPVLMAVLASRLWDVEVKGYTAKLLYTLQSRRSLFFGKAVFGLGEIVLMVALVLESW